MDQLLLAGRSAAFLDELTDTADPDRAHELAKHISKIFDREQVTNCVLALAISVGSALHPIEEGDERVVAIAGFSLLVSRLMRAVDGIREEQRNDA